MKNEADGYTKQVKAVSDDFQIISHAMSMLVIFVLCESEHYYYYDRSGLSGNNHKRPPCRSHILEIRQPRFTLKNIGSFIANINGWVSQQ